jgi:FixJ family two-component response regulator
MPEMTGPDLQEELAKADYCMPIIFLSAHGDVPTTALTMKRGAVDFLTKPVDRDDLLGAIRAALALDAESRAQLGVRGSARQRLEKLTPREHEVMSYVISGMLNKQIAVELGIAEYTVKVHRGRVMHKLGIDSVPELVRLCEKAGVAPAKRKGK